MTEYVGAHWIRAALQVNPFGYKGGNEPAMDRMPLVCGTVRVFEISRPQCGSRAPEPAFGWWVMVVDEKLL